MNLFSSLMTTLGLLLLTAPLALGGFANECTGQGYSTDEEGILHLNCTGPCGATEACGERVAMDNGTPVRIYCGCNDDDPEPNCCHLIILLSQKEGEPDEEGTWGDCVSCGLTGACTKVGTGASAQRSCQ